MTELPTLWLPDFGITDQGLSALNGLTKLEHFIVHANRITDAGLVHLEGCPSLRKLSPAGTAIIDAGLVCV